MSQVVTLPKPSPDEPTLRPRIIADVLAAAHLSYLVDSPFRERGGIMFVSYPQMLKSSLIGTLRQFPDAHVLSDINQQQMSEIRDSIAQGRVRTVAFDEFNKLYQRNPQTAAHLEGTIMAVVAQGWTGPSFKTQNVPQHPARCLIVGGLTKQIYEMRIQQWRDIGFAERFLWCHYVLTDVRLIGDAIERQALLRISADRWEQQFTPIPMNLTDKEKREIRGWLHSQPGNNTVALTLMLKIAAVLKDHYQRSPATANAHLHMDVLREFSLTLGNTYALLDPTNDSPITPHRNGKANKHKRGK